MDECLRRCQEKPTCICCKHREIVDLCSCELCGGGFTINCNITGCYVGDDDPICDKFEKSEECL